MKKIGGNRKVLVVDDDEKICALIKRRFKDKECDIEVVHDAMTAICKLYKFKPDVMLLDVHMPGLEGNELLKTIRAFRPEVRVIMMTAYKDENIEKECLENGAAAYFEKPFSFDDLYGQITASQRPSSTKADAHDAEMALKILEKNKLITPAEIKEEIKRIKGNG